MVLFYYCIFTIISINIISLIINLDNFIYYYFLNIVKKINIYTPLFATIITVRYFNSTCIYINIEYKEIILNIKSLFYILLITGLIVYFLHLFIYCLFFHKSL